MTTVASVRYVSGGQLFIAVKAPAQTNCASELRVEATGTGCAEGSAYFLSFSSEAP